MITTAKKLRDALEAYADDTVILVDKVTAIVHEDVLGAEEELPCTCGHAPSDHDHLYQDEWRPGTPGLGGCLRVDCTKCRGYEPARMVLTSKALELGLGR